mmetsp:Transcript_73828/g.85721  ORF Transcript_73828/g.85721 Transcript_73828/m.85721 type:complete len:108 (+) Transcript_73828:67-390(+)
MTKQQQEQNSMQMGNQSQGEKEVQARAYDEVAAQERMSKLREKVKQQKTAEKAREAELAKVEVATGDVEMLADAMMCTPVIAERRLRERNGDVKAVLRDALSGKYVK